MIKYDVNTENRTVTATITGCSEDVVRRISRVNNTVMSNPAVKKAATIGDTFSAVAKCHPDDEFNEDTGKEVAKRKLLDKYHTARAKACNRVEVAVNKVAGDVERTASNETQRIIELIRKHGEN